MAGSNTLSFRDRRPSLGFDQLPSDLLATVFSRLDLRSLRSVASACTSFRFAADEALSFIPSFDLIEIAPTLELLRPLLPPNPFLRSLKVDCRRLDDSAIGLLARPSLHDINLHNCECLSGRLLSEIGAKCSQLRSLSLNSLAERRRLAILFSDLEELLKGCSQLESLSLAFDISSFSHPKFAQVWTNASEKLTSLEIGYIPMSMATELLELTVESHQLPLFPNLQKLCLSVDYITDTLVGYISTGLVSLTHLDLQDAPIVEPSAEFDLTDVGLQQINPHRKLKHLSLIRNQEFLVTYFRRVNDQSLLFMAETCSSLESINLGGFCLVTDTGVRALLHSCSRLCKLRVSHGSQLTDLVFHDISATSLSLTHVSLRWCNLLTDIGVIRLSSNSDLTVLDLRDCRKLRDDALKALSFLSKLQMLHLGGTDISDIGLSYLASGACPLISLSVRGCKKLTDKCISYIFGGSFARGLQVLDLSKLPNLTDDGILSLAKSRVPILELRIRECPHIGNTSVMALASMQIEGGSHGSSLQVLDVYDCGGITPRAIQWFKKPYFRNLRWLGVLGSLNRDVVDALARTRPFLHVACLGEELGNGYWDTSAGWYWHEEDEIDELEQWLLEGEDEPGDDDEEYSDQDDDDEEYSDQDEPMQEW